MQARLLVLSTLCIFARAAGAQSLGPADTLPAIAPGARVRLEAPGIVAGDYVGVLRERSLDVVTLTGPSTTVMVPAARITVLQVSQGKSRLDGAVRGLAWAAPIGLFAGMIGMTEWGRCDGRCGGDEFGYVNKGVGVVASTTFSTALIGAGIGALVGRERWATLRGHGDAH